MATSFILSTPKIGFEPFTASDLPTKCSAPLTSSSPSHGEVQNLEYRMYVISRNGNGEVSYLPLKDGGRNVASYRMRTEKWRPIEGVTNFEVVVHGPWIYVIGGFDKKLGCALNRMIRFHPGEGVWTQCQPMSQPRSRFGTCLVDNKLWVCGGERDDGKPTSSCELYDLDLNTWHKCGVLLAPRAGPVCVADGSGLLCAGGFYNGVAQSNLWLYEEHQWKELDEHYPHHLPYSLDRPAVTAFNNTFYFIGGVTSKSETDKKPKTSKASKSKNANKKSEMTTTTLASNSKHSGNFLPSQNELRTSQVSLSDTERTTSVQTGKPDVGKSTESSVRVKGQEKDVQSRFQTLSSVFSFTTNIVAGETKDEVSQLNLISPWNLKLPPLIHPRHSAGAVTLGNRILVVGGTCIETGQAVNTAETFDLITGIWEEDFSTRRCDVSSVHCLVVAVPTFPPEEKKQYRLRWVMW